MKDIKKPINISGSIFPAQTALMVFLIIMFILNVPVFGQKNNLAQLEHLKHPNIFGGKAFGLLFQLYFSSPETPKGPLQLFPRARWPESLNTPKSEWIGLYALPVPDSMITLPSYTPQEGINASLAIWEYGEVAEILHLGPYTSEDSTINLLREFVHKEGYVIVGGHEEEYIVGPTVSSKGDPEKYVTIIRYRVRKIN
jgi:hypothetical protein